MKKLFFIFILFFSSNAHSSIIELEDCYLNDDLKSKKWNEADYNLANTFFIKFTEHNRRESAEYPYGVRDSIRSYKGINEEELLSKGYKKIKQWEKYSITIDDRYITILRIVTDEWLENQREYKRRELERWEKYGTNLPASAVENFRNYQFERRNIDKFKIDDVIANFIYGVGQIFSVEINTDNLEFKQSLSLDTLKKGRRHHSNFTHICNSKQNKDQTPSGKRSGTAFFINSKGYLLTNNHVVEGCELQQVKYNDKDYEAKIIATDKTLDLALMKIEAKPKNYLKFSESSLEKLQKVYVAGYPFGKGLSDDLKISSGIVSSVKGFDDNSNEFQLDAAINPGNSGGPIVDDTGELIGIAVAGFAKDKSEGINFGIKSLSAVAFLKTNNIDPETSFMTFGMNNKKLLQLLEESTVYTYCN